MRNLDDAPDWLSSPPFLYFEVNKILVSRRAIADISLSWGHFLVLEETSEYVSVDGPFFVWYSSLALSAR